MRFVKTDSFHSAISYEAETGCPVLEGSANAEEDSYGCHKKRADGISVLQFFISMYWTENTIKVRERSHRMSRKRVFGYVHLVSQKYH